MSQEEFTSLVKKGDSLVSAGKLDQAVNTYLQALQIEPDNVGVRLNVVKIYMKMREFAEGISQYIVLAENLSKAGKNQEAQKVYQELIAIGSSQTAKLNIIDRRTLSSNLPQIQEAVAGRLRQIQYNLASLYYENGASDEAIGLLKTTLDNFPDEESLHSLLGRIYFDKEKFSEAQGEYQEVIRINPASSASAYEAIGDIFHQSNKETADTVIWYKNAAELYMKNEQIDEAIRIYENILNMDPKDTGSKETLAEIYFQVENIEDGVRTLKSLADIYIEEESLDKVIGVYEKILEYSPENIGIKEKAIGVYGRVLEADPFNLSARHKLIQALLSSGKAKEAVPQFLALAKAYLEKDMLEEGFSVCKKLLEINPNEAQAHEILARFYSKRNQKDIAMDEFIKAVNLYRDTGKLQEAKNLNIEMKRLYPEQKAISYQEALSMVSEGKFEEAEPILEEIIMGDPQHLSALKLLVKVYQKIGALDKILSAYQKILQADPADISSREELIDYYLNFGRIDDGVKESAYLADIYFESGKLAEAENLYKNILTFFPRKVEIRKSLADLYLRKNLYDKAKEEYILLLNYYTKTEQMPYAIELCKKALEVSPEDINAHLRLARLAQGSGLVELAVKEHSYLSDYYLNSNLMDEARQLLENLLELSPDANDYREKLIGILKQGGYIEDVKSQYKILIDSYLKSDLRSKAQDIYSKIVQTDPQDLEIRRQVCKIYLNRDFESSALEIFKELLGIYESQKNIEKCLEINSDNLIVLYSQAQYKSYLEYEEKNALWYLQLNQREKAVGEYVDIFKKAILHGVSSKAEEILPKLVEIWTQDPKEAIAGLESLAFEFKENSQLESEVMILKSLIPLYEDEKDYDKEVSALSYIKQYHRELGQFDNVLEYLDKITFLYLKLNQPDRASDALFEKLEVYFKINRPDEVQAVFSEILAKIDEGEAKLRLGQLYFDYKYFDQALPYFNEVFANSPENVEILSKLAILNIRLGKLSEAVDMVKDVYAKNKDFQVIEEYIKAAAVEFEKAKFEFNLAHLYKEIGFYEEAVINFLECAQDRFFVLSANSMIAETFISQGLFDLAVEQYNKTLKIEGFPEEDYLDIRYNFASYLEATDKLKEALEHYHECYAVDIKYKDVALRIEKLNKILQEKQ